MKYLLAGSTLEILRPGCPPSGKARAEEEALLAASLETTSQLELLMHERRQNRHPKVHTLQDEAHRRDWHRGRSRLYSVSQICSYSRGQAQSEQI
jgi:hypothetical protein